MPSYLSYMRQMTVMDANDDNIESWITVRGNHIPIMKGQSKEDAVKSFLEKKGGSGEKKPESKAKKENKSSALVVAERAARYWGKQDPKGMVGIYGREMRETAKELRGLEGEKIYNEKHDVALARAKRQAEYWEKEAKNQKGRGMTGIMARERREIYNEIKENVPSAHKIDPYNVKQGDFISFTPEGRKYEVLGYTSGGLTGLIDVKSRKRIDRKIRLTETVYKHTKGVEKMVDTENLGKKAPKVTKVDAKK